MHKYLLAAALLLAAGTAAQAQTLVSADNGAATTYSSGVNQLYALDGTNTALAFTTHKPNEVVQLSFSASRCGVQQVGPASTYTLNESAAQGFFYIDGNLVPTGTGNANTLCYYNLYPQAPYMILWGTGQMQQRFVVPVAGKHTVGVLFQTIVTNDGTQILPVFGQTHLTVSK